MSRIRSIHPGLWTDEAFVSLSAFARLLAIGIWNECDDKGIFPWSPIKLKMRLLPADSVDAGELLAEIEQAGLVKKYVLGGKSYGAVRNFTKFQRPKKPNDIHPATPNILAFAGTGGELASDEMNGFPHQFPTSGEIPPQREEGGDKGKEIEPNGSVISVPENDDARELISDWNSLAADLGLPKVAKLTEMRKRAIRSRLRQNTLDEWKEAFRAIRRSRFCQGENERGWKADFDFLLQPKSFTRLIEGFYDGKVR